MTTISLEYITIDPRIQLRARDVDSHTVGAYIEAITGGAQFPPIILFSDGQTNWLADGFHRVSAYRFLNLPDIEADVRPGTRQEALVFAATANVTNGRPMSQAEKREAGERLIKLTDWSDREISRQLVVSHTAIQKWRNSLSGNKLPDKPRTVTRNGSTYTMDTSNIGKTNGQAIPLFDDPPTEAAPELLPAESIPDSINLICGDFAEISNQIEPGSIDAIITDPPYPYEFLYLYGLLAERAARLLKPGGSLLAMCGQSYLPDVIDLMKPHLNYQWVLSYQTPGGQSPQIWPRRINTFWKPILWFVNGEYGGAWHGDVIKSDMNDKRFHHWGQSESGIYRLVDDHSLPGDLILDPFLGGGTTGLVAVALKRRFIGIDIDAQAIETSRKRINDYLNTETS